MNTYITLFLVGFFSSMILLTTYQAYGQEVKDGIYEDQIIVCVNGSVIELSGNICKVFNVDDQSITDAQDQLYQDPDNDTFQMDVRD